MVAYRLPSPAPSSTNTTNCFPHNNKRKNSLTFHDDTNTNANANNYEHYIDDERIVKNLTKPDQITSETEWPQFIHPDGGIIKITPWGTLRQFVDPKTNETITKFEDCSLEDYSFKSESIEKLYQTPNTPQSIYHNAGQDNIIHTPHNGNRNLSGLIISPESEVEGYVVDGYRQQQQQQQQPQQQQQQHQQFHQQRDCFVPEHENYFGMTDDTVKLEDEIDSSFNIDEEML
ncbi:hypothetical protein I503_05151 [Candida albicans SC5314]|uniref:Uncharacterized protein n=2 Tax=Candida albicans TaxID=5476 RepID=Q5AGV8_CANAL|nr:uncharacterized protein CAALFM_C701490WA [Candida albicans SC5314]KGT65154.1 hypothetical protein MEK_05086 [Candida albicans 12C]BAE44669.1 hypothetical protein [Candida albicans]AOW30516.1 hypothetical protein CAALFM_C701490WA [Candida albicans SC5314]KHC71833.1 hypothetical protein W5Q_05192 [Candida albicans SC5314]KHC80957.1 hypothetical protein I503_05151 [Candida albicans SC5314]|eukprot:XP_721416.1 hypothetical protein CAALFM_C701490WA [Candida albicans SC5314]